MARTKQTARKSTGGRAPRRQVFTSTRPSNSNTGIPNIVNLVDLDPTLDPTCMKVMDIKEKLQRAIVQAAKEDGGINKKDLPDCDELFKELAQQPMTVEYLHHTKIVKVMKQIRDMEDDQIPLDEEYEFRERASTFLNSLTSLPGVKSIAANA